MIAFYHHPCVDGRLARDIFLAANPTAKAVPLDYGDLRLEEIGAWMVGQKVYFLDCSLKAEQFDKVEHHALDIVVIDHHKTCPIYYPCISFVFDLNKSGSRLTWEHFGRPAGWEKLVDYVEDRDLWRWKLPHSREISAAISCFANGWPDLSRFEETVSIGQTVLTYQQRLIEQILANKQLAIVADQPIWTVNSPIFQSEIGEALAKEHQIGAVWYQNAAGKEVVSLRSIGDIDVAEIARSQGGGGHKNAAGYTK